MASGTTNGNYRWYDGTVLIPGAVNSNFPTPALSANRNFGVSIFDGTCESPVTQILASVQVCSPPVISTNVTAPFLPTIIRINLAPLLSDPEGNLDLSTLAIVGTLPSGATATIEGTELVINYIGIPFPGIETIVLRVCDLTGMCTDETLTINLSSEIGIYNAVSSNSDGKNEIFYIENIDLLPETQKNKVTIFNRWGSVVFEATNYDNANRVFKGIGSNGSELPPGTYYYSIEFSSGAPKRTGFLSLRK
jgi:gliding motility-associated-like protein